MINFSNRYYKTTNGGNIWLLFLLVVIGMIVLLPYLSFAMGTKGKMEGKRLYIYSDREILNFFEDIGYIDLWANSEKMISRNSDGTELRFFSKRKKRLSQ